MKPEQSSMERMRVKGTPTEDIRAWCGFAHKVVELTGPTQNDALELWLHEDSADTLLDMCDEVDERFRQLQEEYETDRHEAEALNNFLSYVAERCGTKECPSLIDYVNQLRELVHDLLLLPSVPAFDCFGCKYEEHHDCESGFKCRLVERGKRLGIEVESGKRTRG